MNLRVDHFAVAVHSIDQALAFFGSFLPVRMNEPVRPGYTDDFRWCDFYVGHVKMELIESTRPGSFVERFLERRGEGIHHLTCNVDVLDPMLDEMAANGLRIVDRFDAGDGEKTAFISPRSALGMLLQFWQVRDLEPPSPEVAPRIARLPGVDARMRFDHLSVATSDLPAAVAFFRRWFPIERWTPRHPGYSGDFELQQFDIGSFRVEVIADLGGTSFVRRFLDKRGEGFHHLSIDVDDLAPVVERLRAAGVRIVDEADIGGGYKTAFVSPRSAHGVLIQFWQVPDLESPGW